MYIVQDNTSKLLVCINENIKFLIANTHCLFPLPYGRGICMLVPAAMLSLKLISPKHLKVIHLLDVNFEECVSLLINLQVLFLIILRGLQPRPPPPRLCVNM